jgi:cell division transport system ATP-binding protein
MTGNGLAKPPLFSLENISVTYGRIKALSEINLKISKGEMIFLTGPSGSGKTTLLKLLTKDIKQTSGKLSFHGPDKLFVAPVYQDLKLLENQTVEENLWCAYDKKIYGTKKYFASEVKELTHLLAMQNRMDLKVSLANGGLRHKTAFLRALLTRPDVLIADELTASLDYDNARKMYDILNLLNVKRGLTVIWATHNRDLINKFSGKIIHLDNGRIIHSGQSCFM